MNRARTFLAICALALPISLIAACGEDEAAEEDPREVIQRTVDNDTDVTSGVIDLSMSANAEGDGGGSFEATVAGSFQGEEGEEQARDLPQLDITGSVTGESEADDESVDESGRVIVTEDNAFVEYQEETYEAGPELRDMLRQQVSEQVGEADQDATAREACEQAIQQAGGDPAACDIDVLGDWLTNLENEGSEDVEGTEAIHISGDLNAQQMLSDLGGLAQSVPGVGLQGIDPAQFADAVEEAHFDLFTGAEDYLLRRLEGRIVIDPAAVPGGEQEEVETVEIDLSLTLSELNEPQTIEAPEGPTTPLEDLLGGLGGLGLDAPPGGQQNGAGAGAGAGADEDVDPEQAQAYLACLEEAAGSNDPAAIEACAEHLE